jgi:hypothetical protein
MTDAQIELAESDDRAVQKQFARIVGDDCERGRVSLHAEHELPRANSRIKPR